MFKSFAYGILVGCIISGIFWYSTGRNDLKQIRADLDNTNGNFKTVQRSLGELSTNSDGFAGDLIAVTTGIKSSSERLRSGNERLSESDGLVGEQLIKMEQLADWHKQSLILGRDLGDVAYELRQLNKESRTEK